MVSILPCLTLSVCAPLPSYGDGRLYCEGFYILNFLENLLNTDPYYLYNYHHSYKFDILV